MFERGVQREENEGRVNVGEHEDDGEGAVEEEADGLAGDVEVLKKTVEDAVGAEDGLPGIASDEVADPQRNDNKLIEKLLAYTSVERHVVGKGIAKEERKEHDAGGDARSAEEDFDVHGILKKFGVILEIPLVDKEAVANEPEAVGEHESVGKEKEKGDPEEGRGGDDGFVEARVHGHQAEIRK
jgi:hypothetical protein